MRPTLATPILLAVLAGAAACSSTADPGIASVNGGDTPSSSSAVAPNAVAAFQRFAQCMRQHDQNVPDPDAQGNLNMSPPPGGDATAWNAAMRACQHYLPSQNGGGGIDQQELAAFRAFAVCLRAHGIDVSDPDPANGKIKFEGRLTYASRAQIQNDPQYRAANDACKDKLPGNGKGK
jgi:hypothetical protein